MSDTQQADAQTQTVSVEEFNKIKSRAEKFEAHLADYEKRFKGVDIEALKAKAAEADILSKQAAVGDEKKIDELIAKKEQEIRKGIERELEEGKATIQKLSLRNKELEVTDKVFAQAAIKFNADCHEDVKAKIRAYCDRDEDGSYIIKDDEGKVRYSPAKPSQKMSPDEFIQELIGQKPSWATAKIQPGGKSGLFKMATTDAKTVSVDDYAKMTNDERRHLPPSVRTKFATQILKST